jgi:TonB family protein
LTYRSLFSYLSYMKKLFLAILAAFVGSTFLQGTTFESQMLKPTYVPVVSPAKDYDVPPKLVRGFAPFYPPGYSLKRRQGDVIMECTVDVDGKPKDLRIMSSTRPGFARRSIDALIQWQFAPATKNGKPVAVRVRIPFHFRA